jgi:hypothetical protein
VRVDTPGGIVLETTSLCLRTREAPSSASSKRPTCRVIRAATDTSGRRPAMARDRVGFVLDRGKPSRRSKVGCGASGLVPPVEAERPLSAQSVGLRRDAGQTYKMRRFRPWYRRPPLPTADKRLTAFFNREVMFFLV